MCSVVGGGDYLAHLVNTETYYGIAVLSNDYPEFIQVASTTFATINVADEAVIARRFWGVFNVEFHSLFSATNILGLRNYVVKFPSYAKGCAPFWSGFHN